MVVEGDRVDGERTWGEARRHLLRLLAHRPRSVAEARRRLQRAGFPADVLEAVIEEACDRGWLDDEVFARLWIQDRLQRKPRSRSLLARELRAQGLSDGVIERALARETADWDEARTIRELAEERLPRYRGLDRPTQERRLYSFLRRRGFSPEAIRRALSHLDAPSPREPETGG